MTRVETVRVRVPELSSYTEAANAAIAKVEADGGRVLQVIQPHSLFSSRSRRTEDWQVSLLVERP